MRPKWIHSAAAKIGVTVEEYEARTAAGEKWCCACKRWQLLAEFGRDGSTASGRAYRCKASDASIKRAKRAPFLRGRKLKTPPPPPEHVAVLHEVYHLAVARRPHTEIMDRIRAAIGRP